MTPTGHADLGVQNQPSYLKQNQGPKVLDSSLARGPLQCQSEHYNTISWDYDRERRCQCQCGGTGSSLGSLPSRPGGPGAPQWYQPALTVTFVRVSTGMVISLSAEGNLPV